MGTKTDPAPNDCYVRTLPDEPIFTLLGRDPAAPRLIRDWAYDRGWQIETGVRPESDAEIVAEALLCAANMEVWRAANLGKWRRREEAKTDGVI